MGFQVGNLCREASTTTGTGSLTLTGAVSAKYTTLNSDIPLGFAFYGKIEHQTLDEWEIGYYTLTTSTNLERSIVVKSSNGNAAVNFSAGTKHIFSDILGQNINSQFLAKRAVFAYPNTNGTTYTGSYTAGSIGTATASAVTATNKQKSVPTVNHRVTTASTTAIAGVRATVQMDFLSNVSYQGGFDYEFIWGGDTGQSTSTKREFAGLRGVTTAPTDVNPSTLTNIIGFGFDSADTNMQFMCNDGTGTATKVDLGSNFVKPTTDAANIYLGRLYALPNSTRVAWWIANMQTLATASGVATTDLPAANTLLSYAAWESVGGTSSVIGLASGGYVSQAPIVFVG